MLGSPLDAEEVVQEAFLNVWRGSGTYQPERSGARSWLLSVVHHRSIDKIRGRQSRVQPVTLDPGVELADSADVWRQVSERLTGQEVRRALELLPAEQRETIELAYFKGYTQTQIADMLAVPLGTVKGRMRIGLHKLRSLLAEPERELAQE
ncbi:MAG TPA: sigma-70 family RNA polymerase sigma factor, partial [Chloroflexota bacterium]